MLGGSQSRYGRFREGKSLAPLGTDQRSFGCAAPTLVAIPTELSRPLLMSAIWLSRFLVAILATIELVGY